MVGDRWAAVAVAAIGALGIIAAGVIGYVSGSNAVAKDYVQIAVNMLDKKETSPELRRWAVNVLSDLSPVPFGEKLKEELTNKGVYRERLIFKKFETPPVLLKPCPNFLPKSSSLSEKDAIKAANEYDKCRIQMDVLIEYIAGVNSIIDKANKDQLAMENEYRKSVGIPLLKELPEARTGK